MIGTLTAWVLVGIIVIMLAILAIAPFMLSSEISQEEEKRDGL
jgi:uncharacterized membrane protein